MSTIIGTSRHELARRFQALSDAKRLRILDILRDGEHCVCDLTDALDVSQSLLSFHLKTLKDAGLVTDRREGRWVHYALVSGVIEELEGMLAELRSQTDCGLRGSARHCCD